MVKNQLEIDSGIHTKGNRKLLEIIIGQYPHDFEIGIDFLNRTQKESLMIKEKFFSF